LYTDQKIKLIGELATIYKERVVEYTLFQDDCKYTYVTLVQQHGRSFEEVALADMTRRYPKLNIALVTKINEFFATYSTYYPQRPTDSNGDAVQIIAKARAFPFKTVHPDKKLAMDICDILAHVMKCDLLPVKDKLRRNLQWSDYSEFYDD